MLAYNNKDLLRSSFTLGKGDKLFQHNERAVLKHVFWNENVTQSQIAEVTKIPQQTMSRMVKSLIDLGALNQTDTISSSSRGKPGTNLEPNPNYAYTFGLSILLNAIAITVMNFKGEVVGTQLIEMEDMSIKHVLKNVSLLIDELSLQYKIPYERILGIGVGISGFFSSMDGKMNTHHALEEWAQINIAKIVADTFNLPTWVVNDGTGAAAGEGIVGKGKEYKNFVYLFISSAFGGGLINNLDILKGTYGNAGELGDMLPPKLYSHPNLELFRRILLKNGVEIPSIYSLNETYDPQWPGVDEWIYKVQDSFDLVATCSSALLDTQAIIIGGHIPKKLAEKIIPRIDVYAQFRRGEKRPQPKIVCADVVTNPVAVGAATLPLRDWCF
ncbi:ROK family transcriptional regulator [Pseudocolwellia agarivorans]|uniref:ROK family transcriptional regulator n=1 Tax=Pseudocolwellia agarivorans TaxID=1911682 RepID=UPI000986BB7F|nr:ROK family transcriptional regulator [Pseudocolwellia agarivorans]